MRRAPFENRVDAGEQLGRAVAARLRDLPEAPDPVVLALPRGGVPVAREVARICGAPLDLLMVRKLGMPGYEELAAGAVVDGDPPEMVVNPEVLMMAGMTEEDLVPIRDRELAEMARRREIYLAGRKPVDVRGRDAIVVDDGIATGATVRAAVKGLRRKSPRRILVAVPVAPPETLVQLGKDVDDLICLEEPRPFSAVGAHYRDFGQVNDREVTECLNDCEIGRK